MVGFTVDMANVGILKMLKEALAVNEGWEESTLVLALLKKFATVKASTSIISFRMLRFSANISLSRRPHNSAAREYVWPIFLVQPLIQAPRESLMIAAAQAQLRLPRVEPLLFNLEKPDWGWVQPMRWMGLGVERSLEGREWKRLVAVERILLRMMSGLKLESSQSNLFLAD